jgi:hypothetical protein
MLPLDDPRWADLTHAYGPASDIPDLLRRLEATPGQKADYRDEPWFTMWSSLCHQGDVYTASYAALLHVVRIATEKLGPIAFDFFQLPAAIEVARTKGSAPAVPAFLAEGYRTGVASLMDCARVHSGDDWDQSMVLCVAAAQAVAKGHPATAEALMNLDDDWIAKINDPEQWV